MVFTYKRKRPEFDASKLVEAVNAVRERKMSARAAAKLYGVSRQAVDRNVKINKANADIVVKPRGHASFFSKVQEASLAKFVLETSDIYYGMTPVDVRKVAYEFAKKRKLRYPDAWNKKQMAGKDWLSKFMKRHPTLSLRRPQPTSLARNMCFNRPTVALPTCSMKIPPTMVFSITQEKDLVEYIIKCVNHYNGLSIDELRVLAYQFAKKLNLKYPSAWNEDSKAGRKWYYLFMKRHPEITLRTPEQIGAKLRQKFVDPELSLLNTEDSKEGVAIPHNSASKANSSDDDSDSDYFGDRNEEIDPSKDTLDEDMSQQMQPHLKKRKLDDHLADENLTENLVTVGSDILNGSRNAAKGHGTSIERRKREKFIDADEKWWQAQYALYLKLTKAQKFEMKKTISELQLKFEYQNLQNVEPEMMYETRHHSEDDSDSNDDPLDIKSLW